MKIKKYNQFNEALTEPQLAKMIEEFCELNLAYLLDDDNDIVVEYKRTGICAGIWSGRDYPLVDDKLSANMYEDHPLTWYKIKDRFIPFTVLLNNNFSILRNEFEFIDTDYTITKVNIADIESVKDMSLVAITFIITNEKVH